METYIQNKKIDTSKFNNVAELKGISDAIWNFLSSFYNSGQDSFYANSNNKSFRQKVSTKFILKVNSINTEKKGNKSVDKLASVKRLSLPILAIPPKKINEISKYFKTSNSNNPDNNKSELYAQASKVRSFTKEILKIKDAFSSFKADKIDNIH